MLFYFYCTSVTLPLTSPCQVQELFMRQLCQVPGVSGSKARGITAVYPTLSCLMERLHACADAKEKEKLLVNVQWQVKAGSRCVLQYSEKADYSWEHQIMPRASTAVVGSRCVE